MRPVHAALLAPTIALLATAVATASAAADPGDTLPPAVRAMLNNEPLPLADGSGAVQPGVVPPPGLAWQSEETATAQSWQRLEDPHFTAWRIEGGPVEWVSIASDSIPPGDREIVSPVGTTTIGSDPPDAIWATARPGLVAFEDTRFFRFRPDASRDYWVPLWGLSPVKLDFDRLAGFDAMLVRREFGDSAELLRPYITGTTPEAAARIEHLIEEFARCVPSGALAADSQLSPSRIEEMCDELAELLGVGSDRLTDAAKSAVRADAAKLGEWHAAYAEKYGPVAEYSRSDLGDSIRDLRLLAEPAEAGLFESYIRGVLRARPIDEVFRPETITTNRPALLEFLEAARRADAMKDGVKTLEEAIPTLKKTPGIGDADATLHALGVARITQEADAAERDGWPATAAMFLLQAHQFDRGRVTDTITLADLPNSGNTSRIGRARRLLAPIASKVWPVLDPADEHTARVSHLFHSMADYAVAPIQGVLGLRPGDPAKRFESVKADNPDFDPIVLADGSENLHLLPKSGASTPVWRRTFYAENFDRNDPEEVQAHLVSSLEKKFHDEVRTLGMWNTDSMEAELAELYAMRDAVGGSHRSLSNSIAAGQARLREGEVASALGGGSSMARENFQTASREYAEELNNRAYRADQLKDQWNNIDGRIRELSDEIDRFKRLQPTPQKYEELRELTVRIEAERAKLPALGGVAARMKRHTRFTQYDDQRAEALWEYYTWSVGRLTDGLLESLPDSDEKRSREIAWTLWWLGLVGEGLYAVPDSEKPKLWVTDEVARDVFAHFANTALSQEDPRETMTKGVITLCNILPWTDDDPLRGVMQPILRKFIMETGEGAAANALAAAGVTLKYVKLTVHSPAADGVLAALPESYRERVAPVFAAAAKE